MIRRLKENSSGKIQRLRLLKFSTVDSVFTMDKKLTFIPYRGKDLHLQILP
jgi:hypothetical protein